MWPTGCFALVLQKRLLWCWHQLCQIWMKLSIFWVLTRKVLLRGSYEATHVKVMRPLSKVEACHNQGKGRIWPLCNFSKSHEAELVLKFVSSNSQKKELQCFQGPTGYPMPQTCCGLRTPNTLCLLNETAKTGPWEDAVQQLTHCQGLLCCGSCREKVIQKRKYPGLNQAQV